jgi:starvation-inducible DNA-binding protein
MAKNSVNDTRINLPANTRQAVCDTLNQVLANLFDLHSQTKQAHWTVRGPNFWQLHKLFDEAASAIEGFVDEVAERIATLGGLPRGTVRMAAQGSQLPDFPEKFEDIGHVVTLAERFAVAANHVREQIDNTDKQGDKDTSDLLTEISRELDKQLWFLEAHTKREG